MLVGPWYRWGEPGVNGSGRGSRPAIEKYASTDFINQFLVEPQRSLKYQQKDFVHAVVAGGSRYGLSGLTYRKVEPLCRKLFLDIHSRFYLVVAELHCDAPGFPSVARDQVCEAGLVVRRRKVQVAPEIFDDLVAALERSAKTKASILELNERSRSLVGRRATFDKIRSALKGSCDTRAAKLLVQYAEARERLEALTAMNGVQLAHEGWRESEQQGVGFWVDVEETPREITEAVFPLYPLVPDPKDRRHSARDRTLYFGVVPASSSDVDELGNPRFDDRSLYEIRCFVRRHKEPCPKTSAPGDCPGELVWSGRTEKYRLAAPLDLDGTGNRPVTIQLPDMEALKAQAESFPASANVRMLTPPKSSLPFSMDGKDLSSLGGGSGGAEMCFFAIPLITIVANFVLRLFLPIVVFVFGLWFLLKLKFCIPPSLSLIAGVNLDLAVAGQLGLAVEADLDIDVGLEAQLGISMSDLDTDLRAIVLDQFGNAVGGALLAELDLSVANEAEKTRNRNRLVKLLLDLSSDFSADAPPDLAEHFDTFEPGPAGALPSVTAGLEHHDVLEVPVSAR